MRRIGSWLWLIGGIGRLRFVWWIGSRLRLIWRIGRRFGFIRRIGSRLWLIRRIGGWFRFIRRIGRLRLIWGVRRLRFVGWLRFIGRRFRRVLRWLRLVLGIVSATAVTIARRMDPCRRVCCHRGGSEVGGCFSQGLGLASVLRWVMGISRKSRDGKSLDYKANGRVGRERPHLTVPLNDCR